MFRKILLILLIINCSQLTAFSQTQFQRGIGESASDAAISIVRTTDGGYVLAGFTDSFGAGSFDFYIVKLGANGSLQWNNTVGGTGIENAESVIQTNDGGYAVAGHTNSFGAGTYDFYIVKLSSSGSLLWTRTLGQTDLEEASTIVQTADGGYAVAGRTLSFGAGSSDFYIVKLDASGTLQWNKTIGGAAADYVNSIIQTADGGYAVAGFTNSFGAGNGDMYIVKLDGSGSLQWSRTVGGTNGDQANSIIQTADGGYAVAGYTTSIGAGSNDFYIVKLDGSGSLQWSRTVGGTNVDIAESIIRTADGGYAVAGRTNSFGAGNVDFFIVKLNSGGTLLWSRTVGGTDIDDAESIMQTADGGYALAGFTYSFGAGNGDMYIVKLDASGNTCDNFSSPSSSSGGGGILGTPTPTVITPFPIIITPSSTLTSVGGTLTGVCTIGIQPISNEIPGSYGLLQNYPNPFNPATNIRFDIVREGRVSMVIYDVMGRELETIVDEELNAGSYSVNWNATEYSSGLYLYKMTAGDFSETRKMVLIR